ncbi:putative polygalacturonase [Glycine soja]
MDMVKEEQEDQEETKRVPNFFNFRLQKLDEKYWPLMPPLPSYGYGREHPGPRYGSLIHGQHLTDVVITVWLASYTSLMGKEEVSFAANGIVAAGLRAFSLA